MIAAQVYSRGKYGGFQVPNVYSSEKDDITYIIIGRFHSTRHAKLILNKMEVFMENLKYKKIVDIENLDKSGKAKIQVLMEIFIDVIKRYLLAKNRKEKALLLRKLNNYIYILNNEFIYWPI